ncbi:MAG: shikimate dehydrogenase [Pseudomonadota bacterium]
MPEKLLYGVVGDPIAHSLSPLIHNGWMRAAGLPAEYRAIQIAKGEFEQGMRALEAQNVLGLNVTLPHKEAALAYCKGVSLGAGEIGAVNTMSRDIDGSWRGDNTDLAGFLRGLNRAGLTDLSDLNALVLGAGGAARAVIAAVRDTGANIRIANRTLSRAEELAQRFGLPADSCLTLEAGLEILYSADVVVNTTSLGHTGDLGFDWPDGTGRLIYDISYGKAAQRILEPAEKAGWQTIDGLGMLVGQAAAAFEIWFETAPDEDDAYDRCRYALEAAGA